MHGVEPDLTREGGSIPITLVFEEATKSDCVLFPIGSCDDMAHSQNEKIDRTNYLNGIKVYIQSCILVHLRVLQVLGCYLEEIAALETPAIRPVNKRRTGTSIVDYSRWRKKCKNDVMKFG